MRNTNTTIPFIVIYGQEEKSKHCDSSSLLHNLLFSSDIWIKLPTSHLPF